MTGPTTSSVKDSSFGGSGIISNTAGDLLIRWGRKNEGYGLRETGRSWCRTPRAPYTIKVLIFKWSHMSNRTLNFYLKLVWFYYYYSHVFGVYRTISNIYNLRDSLKDKLNWTEKVS